MSQVKPIPEGHHTITPTLVIKGAVEAVEFYKVAFGAEVMHMVMCPSTGKLAHGSLKIGDSMVYLGEEMPEHGCLAPGSVGGSPTSLHLYVADVDAAFRRAADSGATVRMPLMNMFWGDRYGKLTDPFGHEWSMASKVEDVTPEAMRERMLAFSSASSAA